MTLTEWTIQTARDVLDGHRRGWRGYSAFAGAGVIVSVAFVDPGNFATNIQAGAKYGYRLLWAVLLANLIGMLFQALSAKLGVVTGRNLAELCREHFPAPAVVAMWLIAEIAAMATDLAEFVGAGIGLSLLFHIPLLVGMVATGAIVFGILMSGQRGFRPVELIIGGFVAVIAVCYVIEMFITPVDWRAAAIHSLVPAIADPGALLLTVGIIGATVMPHALYLHSGLMQSRIPPRSEAEKGRIVRISNREVVIALAIAGAVNMAMVMMASAAFHAGHGDVAEIETAYNTLTPLLGVAAASVFLLSLLASGVASSAIGTMAGQMIMQGFVGFTIPIWIRRLVTMLPAFAVVALGIDATRALVISQVVLSLALPLPMITLIMLTRRADVMAQFANGRIGNVAAILGATAVLCLNAILVLETIGVPVPGLPPS